jgi:hypothetical protein
MNLILQTLSTPSKHIAFHSLALSIIFTGAVMLLTASELKAVAVFIVPLGIYMVILGLCSEIVFGLRVVISICAQYILSHSKNRSLTSNG